MINQPNLLESLVGNSKDYVESRLTLLKLKFVDKSSDIVAAILSFLPLVFVFIIVFILLNLGIALLIGDLLGKAYWGFLILAVLYLIIGLVIFKQRTKWIKLPFANMLIRKLLKKTEV